MTITLLLTLNFISVVFLYYPMPSLHSYLFPCSSDSIEILRPPAHSHAQTLTHNRTTRSHRPFLIHVKSCHWATLRRWIAIVLLDSLNWSPILQLKVTHHHRVNHRWVAMNRSQFSLAATWWIIGCSILLRDERVKLVKDQIWVLMTWLDMIRSRRGQLA